MTVFAAILFAGVIFACDAPEGYTERQKVYVYHENGSGTAVGACQVYHATNMCDAYCICYRREIYYVSKSNKDGFAYMFWCGSGPMYFNM